MSGRLLPLTALNYVVVTVGSYRSHEIQTNPALRGKSIVSGGADTEGHGHG